MEKDYSDCPTCGSRLEVTGKATKSFKGVDVSQAQTLYAIKDTQSGEYYRGQIFDDGLARATLFSTIDSAQRVLDALAYKEFKITKLTILEEVGDDRDR